MPTTINTDPNVDQPQPPIHPEQSVEEKLDVIITYLHRIDKRDRIRMWSGTLHSLLTLVPLILTLMSLWYFYTHSSDILKGMMGFGGSGTTQNQQSIMDQIQNYLKTQQQ